MLRFVVSYVLMVDVQLSYLEKRSLILHGYGNVLYDHGFSTDAHYHTIPNDLLFSAYIIFHVHTMSDLS